ncbi:hypothetical protein DB347_15370 [Opitutaceae bacterium EW11]|nr:hypothetical protein DB347_15370 [Opitutaceae bacterium EW11]
MGEQSINGRKSSSPVHSAAAEQTEREMLRLKSENEELKRRLNELEIASLSVREARRAALNLMEDAVLSHRRAEKLNVELRESEDRLREVDRRKNHFLAMLGHELRNPLAAIRAGVMLLGSDKAKEETKAATLPIVAQQVMHMERLVEDLLEVSRIAQGRVRIHKEPVGVESVLQGAIDMALAEWGADGFQVHVAPGSESLTVFADRVRLTQVFVNILTNAMKYSGEARRIDVAIGRADGAAEIRIRDYGQGISAALLPHIFEPFVQAKPGLTLEGGLGLGLTVVRQLVEAHGGRISASSDGEGKGSEFSIRIPLCAGAP